MMDIIQTLHEFKEGDDICLKTIDIKGPLKRRLLDLGFVPGTSVKVLQKSPLGDPVAYQVRGTVIALRKEEAKSIFGCKMGVDQL